VGLICVVVAALGSGEAKAEGADARPMDAMRVDAGPPRLAAPAPVRAPSRPDLPTVPRNTPVVPAPVLPGGPTPSAGSQRPAPAPSPFFTPIKPSSLSETAGADATESASGVPGHRRDARRKKHEDGDGSHSRRREDWEARGEAPRKADRGDPAPAPRGVGGDRPTTPVPDTAKPAPAAASSALHAASASKTAELAPLVQPVVPRPGAPSAAMLGLTTREVMVNQLVAIVPLSRDGDLAKDYGLAVDDEATLRSLGVRLVTFTVIRPRGLGDIIDQMGLDSRVQGAQPNFRYRTSASAISTAYPQSRMRIEPALGMASGAGVTVALIDTRVAELSSLLSHVAERVSVIPNSGRGRHGTALAGLIADVAPAARLLSIEAFADDPGDPDVGVSTTLSLARALDAAIDRKVDVINLSVAGPRDPLIGRLVRQALSKGIVVVAAAGNDGPDAPPRYPAAYDGVVAVTATDSRDQPYAAAAQGSHVAVAAPGVDVRATVAEGVVGYVTGTSVAAAQVSGVAALLRERAPRLGSGEARRLLKETASPLAGGPGMVDALAAVSKATAFAGR
jgi:subtilisin family serine protease